MVRNVALADADLDSFCDFEGLSDLTPAAVRLHEPDLLLVQQGPHTLLQARASIWWRRVPALPHERIGLIGHYATRDAAAGVAILEAACSALARHGCTLAIGPMDGSTWRHYRLVTQRGTLPPFFLEPDNPDDWPGHFEAAGFTTLARYYSSINDDNTREHTPAAQVWCEGEQYRLRHFDRAATDRELSTLWKLSCEAFADNFLYSPIEESEFRSAYTPLLPAIRDDLLWFAEANGLPVAFCLALPDLLQARRQRPVDTVIVKTLAVVPAFRGKGVAKALLRQVNRRASELGMHRTIHALMHEANPSRRLDRQSMRDFRCYTLYARHL